MTSTCGVAVTETPDGAPVAGGFGNAPPRNRGFWQRPWARQKVLPTRESALGAKGTIARVHKL